jgi:hypothetical protein
MLSLQLLSDTIAAYRDVTRRDHAHKDDASALFCQNDAQPFRSKQIITSIQIRGRKAYLVLYRLLPERIFLPLLPEKRSGQLAAPSLLRGSSISNPPLHVT